MALTERERQTMVLYDQRGSEWLNYSGGKDRPSFWKAEMKMFEWSLPKNSNVLEIGCGPATDGKYLKEVGIGCVSVDFSKTMLGIAKEVDKKSKLAQMDNYNLGFSDNSFNGFWASATLLHMEKVDLALSELNRVTVNKGIGFISMKEGEGESIDPKTGFYFKYYNHSVFSDKLKSNNFEILRAAKRKGTPSHDYLAYLVRVNK